MQPMRTLGVVAQDEQSNYGVLHSARAAYVLRFILSTNAV
jgi:hypothetical protein